MGNIKTVMVTGGAGYVGSALIPKLLKAGYQVRVLDLYLYGEDIFPTVQNHPALQQIKGDMRNPETVKEAVNGVDAVIHLACISNDPSFELNPALGKSINFDCFEDLVTSSKKAGVKRFIYASSSSVYGVKDVKNVTEDLALEPLTDYSKFKADCEVVLNKLREPGFTTLILRPATVCGYAPRLRLDLTVNILTCAAYHSRKITVFGGDQMRPNIHIDDVCDLYLRSLEWDAKLIDGKTFNAGYDNRKVIEIAEAIRGIVGSDVEIVRQSTNDNRSYHISSEKIKRELQFTPKHTIEDAVKDLVAAFDAKKVPNPLTDIRYYNIKTMQHLKLQ